MYQGGLAHMVERSLCMREVVGSMPTSSNTRISANQSREDGCIHVMRVMLERDYPLHMGIVFLTSLYDSYLIGSSSNPQAIRIRHSPAVWSMYDLSMLRTSG